MSTVARPLVVFALPAECQGLLEAEKAEVVYSGIGKVNSAYTLMRELARREREGIKTSIVINFGTAGSSCFKTHELVECTRFAQRDMDLSPLGFAVGVTPYDEAPAVIEVPKRIPELPTGWCGTGDSFETTKPRVECDIVDMEAFALAKVCQLEAIPFLSVKYVTDGSDHNAHNDWRENLAKAAAKFRELYLRLQGTIVF